MGDERRLTCDVWDLARRGGRLAGNLDSADLPRLAEQVAGGTHALRYALAGFIDERGRAAASLQVEGLLILRCDRCGAPLEVPIAEQVRFFFVASEEELGRLPVDEWPEEPLLGSARFDVRALVEDQAILALPISPRHDRCEGPALAPDGHEGGGVDAPNPFAALSALRRRGH